MLGTIFITLASALTINLVLFLIAFKFRSDKLTDIAYAFSFLTIDIVSLLKANRHDVINWIIFLIVAIWSIRIGGFLLVRVLKVGRDRRFDSIRGNFVKFGKFWLGQAVTSWILMLPATIAMYRGRNITSVAVIGLAVWMVGLAVEATADYQKFTFKQNSQNKDRWIDSGVWKFARHPNYFGEIAVWAGIYIAAFTYLTTAEKLICLTSPLLITVVLLFISGVPILEKSADKRWGKLEAYTDYKQNSRLLVPIPKFSQLHK